METLKNISLDGKSRHILSNNNSKKKEKKIQRHFCFPKAITWMKRERERERVSVCVCEIPNYSTAVKTDSLVLGIKTWQKLISDFLWLRLRGSKDSLWIFWWQVIEKIFC